MIGIHWFTQDERRACVSGETWSKIVAHLVNDYRVVIFGAPNEQDIGSVGINWNARYIELIKAWNSVSLFGNVTGMFNESIRQIVYALRMT